MDLGTEQYQNIIGILRQFQGILAKHNRYFHTIQGILAKNNWYFEEIQGILAKHNWYFKTVRSTFVTDQTHFT